MSWTRLSTHTRTVSQQVHPPMHACAPFFPSPPAFHKKGQSNWINTLPIFTSTCASEHLSLGTIGHTIRGVITFFFWHLTDFKQWTNLELCDVCVHGILFWRHFWLSTIGHYLVTRALNRALNGVFGGDARGTKSKKNEHYWDMPSPRRSKPKSRANPVLRHCLPLALNDNDFLSKGCLCKSLVFFSPPTASGVQLPFETNSIWIFSASILSFFTLFSRTRDRSIGVRNSAFDFGGRGSTDFFR